jgi:ubiquinone/menaquinone biosynthesis C-methylase UbiE
MNQPGVAFENIAEAFSRKALIYDEFGRDHANLARMRRQVYLRVIESLHPGASILELNAGTGTDAAFFARQGFRIHTTDVAPGMIAQIEQKIAQHDLQDRLSVQQCSFTELDQIDRGPFDCIFSNFGGLNCIPDLRVVASGLSRLLRPGGILIWVIMPPVCLWDFTAILKGDLRTARRRWSRDGTLANVEGVRFMTYYFTPRQVADALGRDFQLVRVQGLAVLTPPADRKGFAARYPRLYRLLAALDDKVANHAPLNGWGDFFIITMRYAPRAQS